MTAKQKLDIRFS